MKLLSTILIVLSFFHARGYAEEYSIRKKTPPKKKETSEKKAPPPSSVPGFSKENNRVSNLYWLEDSALFLPEFSDIETVTVETPVIPPPTKIETATQPTQTQEESPNKQIEKDKQNIVFQFLIENKKILLIITLIIIFAVYRLRGNTPTYSNQGRIFSKFRNK